MMVQHFGILRVIRMVKAESFYYIPFAMLDLSRARDMLIWGFEHFRLE